MKILLVYVFFFIINIAFLLFTDVLSGLDASTAIKIIQGGLAVTSPFEQFFIIIMFLLPVAGPVKQFVQRRRETKK